MRRLNVVLAVAICFSAQLQSEPASATAIQWRVEDGGNGHWYEAVYIGPSGIAWYDARDAAIAKGGYLASITSAAENAFVFGLVSDDKFWYWSPFGDSVGPWLGGFQYDKLDEPAGHWAWASGDPWGYTNWASGEPNNGWGAEDYLFFQGAHTSKAPTWNDAEGTNLGTVESGHILGYVIEYTVPEPSTLVLLGVGIAGLLVRAWRRRAR
jgi:hypothetical protein